VKNVIPWLSGSYKKVWRQIENRRHATFTLSDAETFQVGHICYIGAYFEYGRKDFHQIFTEHY